MYRSSLGFVAVALVSCAGTVVGLGVGSGAVDSSPTRAARRQSTGSIELVSRTALPGPPTGLAVGRTRVAVSLALEGVVLARRSDAQVVRHVRIDGAATAIQADGGRFWFADLFHDRGLELDETGKVIRAFAVGPLPGGIALDRHSVWVLGLEEPSVTVADRRGGLASVRLLFDAGELWPGAIAAGPHGVWLATDHRRAVTLFDSERYTLRGQVAVGDVDALAATPAGVWAARRGVGPELVRIDGATFARDAVDLPGNRRVTALAGGLTLVVAIRGAVFVLDPVTGAMRARGDVMDEWEITHVASDGRDLWAVDATHNELLRFRVRLPQANEEEP